MLSYIRLYYRWPVGSLSPFGIPFPTVSTLNQIDLWVCRHELLTLSRYWGQIGYKKPEDPRPSMSPSHAPHFPRTQSPTLPTCYSKPQHCQFYSFSLSPSPLSKPPLNPHITKPTPPHPLAPPPPASRTPSSAPRSHLPRASKSLLPSSPKTSSSSSQTKTPLFLRQPSPASASTNVLAINPIQMPPTSSLILHRYCPLSM